VDSKHPAMRACAVEKGAMGRTALMRPAVFSCVQTGRVTRARPRPAEFHMTAHTRTGGDGDGVRLDVADDDAGGVTSMCLAANCGRRRLRDRGAPHLAWCLEAADRSPGCLNLHVALEGAGMRTWPCR